MSTLRTTTDGRQKPSLQFTIRTLLVVMVGVGLACALIPAQLPSQPNLPLPLVVQSVWASYLMLGFGQVFLCTSWWWEQNTQLTSPPASGFDPAAFIRFGCLLTLPTWGLVVVALLIWKWAGVWVFERATMIFGLWLIVAFLFQLGGLVVNLKNCIYLFRPLEAPIKWLAMLNAVHSLIFALVLFGNVLWVFV